MHAYTTRYGTTVLKGDIQQVPTLPSRVKAALAKEGVQSPLMAAHAVSLVQEHPQLTAAQAVAYVLHKQDA